jgi:hypothetical protein
MSSIPIVAVVLGVMGFFALVCLMYIASLWSIGGGVGADDEKDESWGLAKLVKGFREATREGNHAMDPEEALLLAVRVRGWLSAGLLGFAGLILICATLITWHCISTFGK